MSLMFNASELRQEFDVFRHLSRDLIDPESAYVLDEFSRTLDQIRRTPDTLWRWEISRDRPISTVVTAGDHEPDQNGKHDLYGQVSCVWEVMSIRSPKAKRGLADLVQLAGIASTRLAIMDDGRELSVWSTEVASEGGPGVYFHSQMPDTGLPVPRLPAYALTPVGAIEYLLCELFRSRWPESLAADNARANHWKGIQTERFSRVMDWLRGVITSGGSPVIALQGAVPDPALFL